MSEIKNDCDSISSNHQFRTYHGLLFLLTNSVTSILTIAEFKSLHMHYSVS